MCSYHGRCSHRTTHCRALAALHVEDPHPTAPMVLPQHVLRQVIGHRTPQEPILPAHTDLNWHVVLGHSPPIWTDSFRQYHGLSPPRTPASPCHACNELSLPRTPSWTLPNHMRRHLRGPFSMLRCDLITLFPAQHFTTRNHVLVIQDIHSGYVALRFLYARGDTLRALRGFLSFHSAQRRHTPSFLFTSTPDVFRALRTPTTRICRAPPIHAQELRSRVRRIHDETLLPLADWPFTCKYLFYLHNFSPNDGTTPVDIWTGKRNTLPSLHPFACDVYFRTDSQAPRRGLLLGYTTTGRYIIRDIYTRELLYLRSGVFDHHSSYDPAPTLRAATATQQQPLPTSYRSAVAAEDAALWTDAMDTELRMLHELNVWTLVPPPSGARIIPTKWIYTKKYNPDGSLRKYKARLVVSGNQQTQGEDYFSSFSPVVKQSSVKILLAIAAKFKYHVSFIDVTNAYCWGILSEVTYCKQPPGYQTTDPQGNTLVCKLLKSLYGLPQSGRCWNQRLTEILIQIGLTQSDYDPCIFFKRTHNSFFALSTYVDDNMIVSSNDTLTTFFLNRIKSQIKIVPVTDQLYLGMQITNIPDGFRLDQRAYIDKILHRFQLTDCKSVRTPLIVSQSSEASLHVQKTPPLVSAKPYQEVLGCLLYLSNVSRPDITFPTVAMSIHGHSPMAHHMGILKRILRYLKGTANYGIHFTTYSVGQLYAASDASLCSFPNSKSVSGITIFLGAVPILWRTKQQTLVALSSCEAEIYAIAETCRELVHIRGLLQELAPDLVPSPTILYTDSYSAMYLVLNGGSARTKHFHKRVNFIQDYIKQYDLALKYMPTNTIPADLLTKATPHSTCQQTLATFYGIKPFTEVPQRTTC